MKYPLLYHTPIKLQGHKTFEGAFESNLVKNISITVGGIVLWLIGIMVIVANLSAPSQIFVANNIATEKYKFYRFSDHTLREIEVRNYVNNFTDLLFNLHSQNVKNNHLRAVAISSEVANAQIDHFNSSGVLKKIYSGEASSRIKINEVSISKEKAERVVLVKGILFLDVEGSKIERNLSIALELEEVSRIIEPSGLRIKKWITND